MRKLIGILIMIIGIGFSNCREAEEVLPGEDTTSIREYVSYQIIEEEYDYTRYRDSVVFRMIFNPNNWNPDYQRYIVIEHHTQSTKDAYMYAFEIPFYFIAKNKIGIKQSEKEIEIDIKMGGDIYTVDFTNFSFAKAYHLPLYHSKRFMYQDYFSKFYTVQRLVLQ